MIIGITGTLGAGKGTVVEYLKKKGFVHAAISGSGFLAEEAKRRGLFPERPVLQKIANEYRSKSPTALIEAVYESAKEKIERGENVVLEPQHTLAEVEFIKSKGGIELAVDADLKTRYERIKNRRSSKDDVSFEEFEKIQTQEMFSNDPNKNNLAAAIAAADFKLINNGTQEELFAQVEKALKQRTPPRRRDWLTGV